MEKTKKATKPDNGPRINIRVPEVEKQNLQEISERLNVTSTQIVREAVKQKINELNAKIRESESGVVTI
jgi:hypothetical protein